MFRKALLNPITVSGYLYGVEAVPDSWAAAEPVTRDNLLLGLDTHTDRFWTGLDLPRFLRRKHHQ